MMEYEEIKQITHEQAVEAFLKGEPGGVIRALIGLGLHDGDHDFVEKWAFYWCTSQNIEIAAAALMAMSDLVRVHKRVSKNLTLPILMMLRRRTGLGEYVDDVLDYIKILDTRD